MLNHQDSKAFSAELLPDQSFPILYLVCWAVPSWVQGFAFDFVELSEILYLTDVLLN